MSKQRVKRTPDTVSKARQRLGREMAVWRAGIAAARRESPPAVAKIAFGEAELAKCRKAMLELGRKARRTFWIQ